jgi:hypothetical protein
MKKLIMMMAAALLTGTMSMNAQQSFHRDRIWTDCGNAKIEKMERKYDKKMLHDYAKMERKQAKMERKQAKEMRHYERKMMKDRQFRTYDRVVVRDGRYRPGYAYDRPRIGTRVRHLPPGAVRVRRHGHVYYRADNVLYDILSTAAGIVYAVTGYCS